MLRQTAVSSADAERSLDAVHILSTSYRTPIFAQLKYPSSIPFKIISDLRRMFTKIIMYSVLDEDHATANPAWELTLRLIMTVLSWFPLYVWREVI